jgi:hypothetical protein
METLLQAIHDVFDLTENDLKNIEPKSKRAKIVLLMLQHVYAKDTNFCTLFLHILFATVNL